MVDCVFCAIARGEAPAHVVYEDDDVMVILDKYPVSLGHLLVITREHYEAIHTTPPRLAAKAFLVASALARVYRERLGAPGVKVLTNSGAPAGQVIFHTHIHVVPYWPDRRRVPREEVTEEEARRVIAMLKPHLDVVEEVLAEAGLG